VSAVFPLSLLTGMAGVLSLVGIVTYLLLRE